MWKLISSGLNTSGYIKCLSKLLFDVEKFFAVWLVDLVGEHFAIASCKAYAEVACKIFFLQSIQNITCDQEGVAVYPPVPGLQPSPYYKFRLQKVPLSIIVSVNTIRIQ